AGGHGRRGGHRVHPPPPGPGIHLVVSNAKRGGGRGGAQGVHSSLTAAAHPGQPPSVLEPHIEENREQRPTEQWIAMGAVREPVRPAAPSRSARPRCRCSTRRCRT